MDLSRMQEMLSQANAMRESMKKNLRKRLSRPPRAAVPLKPA